MARLIALILLCIAAFCAADERTCSMPDETILHCPIVEAPLVTELREGFIEFEFTVLPDISVDEIRVIDAGGDPRWTKPATATLSQWKFKQGDQPVRRTQRFAFEFEG